MNFVNKICKILIPLVLALITGLQHGFALTEPHVQMRCSLFDKNKKLLQRYPGDLCVFLDDGRFVSSRLNDIVMYGPDLKIQWTLPVVAHHQINLSLDKKNLLVIGSENVTVTDKQNKKELIRSDVLYVVSLDGKILKTFSHYKQKNQFDKRYYQAAFDRKFDSFTLSDRIKYKDISWELTHTNSFYEIDDNPLSKELSWLQKGNYIVNDISMMIVFVLDKDLKKVIWQSRLSNENWTMFHDVQVHTNGHLLIYDNGTRERPFSRLIELDPRNEKIVWEYKGTLKNKFYSAILGGLQVLKNGHVFYSDITQAPTMREIKPNGDLVWEMSLENGTYLQQAKQGDFSSFLKKNGGF